MEECLYTAQNNPSYRILHAHILPVLHSGGQAYIAASAKTDNGRLISTYLCSRIPDKAAKEFAEVTATGTGRSKVLAQHFIMAFKPGEVTPERAMEIGKEYRAFPVSKEVAL